MNEDFNELDSDEVEENLYNDKEEKQKNGKDKTKHKASHKTKKKVVKKEKKKSQNKRLYINIVIISPIQEFGFSYCL